jgi:hypothetical protein
MLLLLGSSTSINMSTEKAKVSAYLPKHIWDSFESFYKQHDISMSQAVAIVFAEYFGLNLPVDQKKLSQWSTGRAC